MNSVQWCKERRVTFMCLCLCAENEVLCLGVDGDVEHRSFWAAECGETLHSAASCFTEMKPMFHKVEI